MVDYSSIVVSSKIELSRNLVGFNFPSMFSGNDGIKVLNKVSDTLLKEFSDYKYYKISSLSELDKNIMCENGLITDKLLDADSFGGAIVSPDEDIVIMINEFDHIKEVSSLNGLNLIQAFDKLNEIDNQILSKFDIAFDDTLGFLSSNVSMVGTAMKVSVILFLPALFKEGKIKELTTNLFNQGFEMKPVSNLQMETEAYKYTISNIQTIGKKETDFVVRLTEISMMIAKMEISSRGNLLNFENISWLKDKVYRAWGILTNCYVITTVEAQNLLSDLKMGVALDIIRFNDEKMLDILSKNIMPYSLTKISNSKVTTSDLDEYRAKFLNNILKTKRIK